MEEIFLAIKYVLFLGMELTVLVVIAAVLIAGVYQVVHDKVREARRKDEIAPEAPVIAPHS